MRTTYDAEADAAYITLTTNTTPGRSVRNVEVESPTGGSVVLDFDRDDMLLGVEVLSASHVLDESFIAQAERIDL